LPKWGATGGGALNGIFAGAGFIGAGVRGITRGGGAAGLMTGRCTGMGMLFRGIIGAEGLRNLSI
jgi:hypothetical protein